jgi:hypothetical protein
VLQAFGQIEVVGRPSTIIEFKAVMMDVDMPLAAELLQHITNPGASGFRIRNKMTYHR